MTTRKQVTLEENTAASSLRTGCWRVQSDEGLETGMLDVCLSPSVIFQRNVCMVSLCGGTGKSCFPFIRHNFKTSESH